MADRRLTAEQRDALGEVRSRLRSEPDAARPDSVDCVMRADVDAWITGVLARSGRVCPEATKGLHYVTQGAPRGGSARRYADEVDSIVTQAAPDSAEGGRLRTVSLSASLGTATVTFVLLLALHRLVFHHAWGDAVANAGAYAATWVVLQAIIRRFASRSRHRTL